MTLKVMNTIEEIYEGKELIFHKNEWQCPVCKKKYKRQGNAENHLKEQDCYDIKSLIRNTPRETKAWELFTYIMSEINPAARVSISYFRRSKLYTPVSKFSLTCSMYDVADEQLYFVWIELVLKLKHTNAILSHGIKHENIVKFRKWLRDNPSYIDSAEFVKKNEDFLNPDREEYDPDFLILSLQRSHLAVEFYLQYFGLKELVITNMEHEMRLVELYGE